MMDRCMWMDVDGKQAGVVCDGTRGGIWEEKNTRKVKIIERLTKMKGKCIKKKDG